MTASREFEHNRLGVLFGITGGLFDVVLTTPDAALGYTVPPSSLAENLISVSIDGGECGGIAGLVGQLTAAGYIRADAPVPRRSARRGSSRVPGSLRCAAASSMLQRRQCASCVRMAAATAAHSRCA